MAVGHSELIKMNEFRIKIEAVKLQEIQKVFRRIETSAEFWSDRDFCVNANDQLDILLERNIDGSCAFTFFDSLNTRFLLAYIISGEHGVKDLEDLKEELNTCQYIYNFIRLSDRLHGDKVYEQ